MSDLVRAELTKTLTTRLWWGMLIGAVLLTTLQAVVGALVAGLEAGPGMPPSPGLDETATILGVYAQAPLSGTYLFALVMGVTAMTGEYRYQTITPTFLATPRRARVVAAKALAQLGVGAGYGVVAVLTALVGAGIVMLARGFSLAYDTPGLWRAVALAIVAVALWTLLGMGVGTLLRNQVAAILLALGLAIVLQPILGLVLTRARLGRRGGVPARRCGRCDDQLDRWRGPAALVGRSADDDRLRRRLQRPGHPAVRAPRHHLTPQTRGEERWSG